MSIMYSAPGAPPWQTNGHYPANGSQPAYTPVTARHTFSSSSHLPPPPSYVPAPLHSQSSVPPPPGTNSQPPAAKKTAWSPAVRDYVSRSFAAENTIKEVSRPELEVRLKQIITDAASSGRLESTPWNVYPLPQQMILEERRRAVLAPVSLSSPAYPPVSISAHSSGASLQETTPRKRKSSEFASETEDRDSLPPWRSNSKPNGSLADRVTFAPTDKRQKLEEVRTMSKSYQNLDQRKKRFEDSRSGISSPNTPHTPQPELEPVGPIVGRSQKLEKNYFRLTSAPNPDDVRPLEILRQTLEHLKKKWRSDSNYVYICDQFKSLRQDLTVQHIRNEFTTTVYEIHARIALEKGDLGEYNQCQTQLRALYKKHVGGHPVEFKAYRILYFIHTCNRTDMNDVLSDLTPADKLEPAIKHALEVRSALALGNYHKFFRLYLSVPNMGAYLMDMFVERERLAALATICKSYKPDIKLRFVTEELGFENDEESAQFVINHAGEASAELLQEREGHVRLLSGKVGQIFELARKAAFGQIDIKGQI